ncbi:lipocalin-like [Neosynchiropus ocellatus]
MKTLLSLMAALLCVLAARAAPAAPMADFSLEKMAGKWYVPGFATNAAWFVNHKDKMKMGVLTIKNTEDGNMDLSHANLNADGTCWRMSQLANKTDTPGRFTFFSQVWNNDNDMNVVDAVYDQYALVATIKTKNGVSEVLTALYSRTPETSADVQEKFTNLAIVEGVQPENIAMLQFIGECQDA